MEKKQMNIAVSLNQNFFYCTYVMLSSLFENNTESSITVYVLHSELTDEHMDAFDKLAQQYDGQVQSVLIDRSLFSDRLMVTAEWSIEAYYRLIMADVLPREVERILYLDGDIIVNGNIREFYDLNFEDKLLGVCIENENNIEKLPQLNTRMFQELLKQGFYYFNSGVMLWNLKKVREQYSFADYMKVAEEYADVLVTPDQDILNYCYWNQAKYMETAVYNQFTRNAHYEGKSYQQIREEVRIVHFASAKPWNANNLHFDIEQLWWDYAQRTPYYEYLCEEFTRKTINDPFIERFIQEIYDNIAVLQKDLEDSIALSERLIGMIDGK